MRVYIRFTSSRRRLNRCHLYGTSSIYFLRLNSDSFLFFSLSSFRYIATQAVQALTRESLTILDDPVLQHRGRMRHAQACLALLTQDYTRFVANSTKDTACESVNLDNNDVNDGDVKRTNSSICRLLDALWIRPVHLVSRGQIQDELMPNKIIDLDADTVICAQEIGSNTNTSPAPCSETLPRTVEKSAITLDEPDSASVPQSADVVSVSGTTAATTTTEETNQPEKVDPSPVCTGDQTVLLKPGEYVQ